MSRQKQSSGDGLLNSADRIDCASITDEEIEEWIVTTRKVLILLKEESKKAYENVYQEFILDLQLLTDNGRVTETDYEEIADNL